MAIKLLDGFPNTVESSNLACHMDTKRMVFFTAHQCNAFGVLECHLGNVGLGQDKNLQTAG